jgi:hypothetical protein
VWAQDLDASGTITSAYFLVAPRQVLALSVGQDAVNDPLLFVIGLDGQVYGQQLNGTGQGVSGYVLTTPGQVLGLGVGQGLAGSPAVVVIGLDHQVYSQNVLSSSQSLGSYALTAPGLIDDPSHQVVPLGSLTPAVLDLLFASNPLAGSSNFLGIG